MRYGDSWGRIDLGDRYTVSALRIMVTTTSTTRPPGVTALWHLDCTSRTLLMLHDARVEHESATRWPRANFGRPDSRRSDARQQPLIRVWNAGRPHNYISYYVVRSCLHSTCPSVPSFSSSFAIASLKLHLIMHTAGQHTT